MMVRRELDLAALTTLVEDALLGSGLKRNTAVCDVSPLLLTSVVAGCD